MKKFRKQFEGLRMTRRGEAVFMLSFSVICTVCLLSADYVGRLS